jgi:hypothetical protein
MNEKKEGNLEGGEEGGWTIMNETMDGKGNEQKRKRETYRYNTIQMDWMESLAFLFKPEKIGEICKNVKGWMIEWSFLTASG